MRLAKRVELLDLLEKAQATANPDVAIAIDRVLLPHLMRRAEECESMAIALERQGYPRLAANERRAGAEIGTRIARIASRLEANLQ